jgi:type IV pilus assembly protein PilA
MFHPRRSRRGFSLIELLIVIAIILIIIMFAVPKFRSAMMHARETSALVSIRTIHSAQAQYESQFNRYATTLAELGPPATGSPGPAAADLIPTALAHGLKDQYKFTLTGVPGGYQVHADPEVYGSSGGISFYSDQSMEIRANYGPGPATASSPEYGEAAPASGAAPAAGAPSR